MILSAIFAGLLLGLVLLAASIREQRRKNKVWEAAERRRALVARLS